MTSLNELMTFATHALIGTSVLGSAVAFAAMLILPDRRHHYQAIRFANAGSAGLRHRLAAESTLHVSELPANDEPEAASREAA